MSDPRELYEVRIALAGHWLLIRVRAIDAAAAAAEVLALRPGWECLEVTRWAGEGWVPTAPVLWADET